MFEAIFLRRVYNTTHTSLLISPSRHSFPGRRRAWTREHKREREHVGWGLRERGLERACAWAAGEAAGGVWGAV
jgi:hypothetical protein